MAHSMITCYVHVVPDATRAWVTKESPHNVSVISFWYNPNNAVNLGDYNPSNANAMTLGDVVETIENTLGRMKIGHVTVRGLVVKREDLENHKAADHLRDGESFTCHLVPLCCTLL